MWVSTQDLPVGWTDEQQGGKYHLKRTEDDAHFGHNLGPHAWKRFLFPSSALLWKAQRSNGHFEILPLEQDRPRQLNPERRKAAPHVRDP
jgi:sulfhydrogenase subunit beta (sulfur reductase)